MTSTSGVVGLEGRVGPHDPTVLQAGAVRLGGRPLPLVATTRLYVCGITPYDVTHVGHAATFVWADLLASVVRLAGAAAVTTRNVTDVDDVLTRAAETSGRHYDELALGQEFLFGQHMRALGVRRPEHEPRARHHVRHVQQLAAALLATGAAYERDGTVWFRGGHVQEAAGVGVEEARRLSTEYGDRPDDPAKDDPFDVAVWRPSDAQDPAWPSPWGWGRPGWHAECAAMALATLGPVVDVLAGGADLAYPHHAYQSALVEAVSGAAVFARARLAVGTVAQDGAKMAKSTGNLTLVGDLLESHPPAVVRTLLLDRPWSQPWELHAGPDLDAASLRLERLYLAAGRPGPDSAVDSAVARLLDDLDVPGALDVATEAGGPAARRLVAVLGLS